MTKKKKLKDQRAKANEHAREAQADVDIPHGNAPSEYFGPIYSKR